jgi:tRNA threonylcarbamoyladenosine biosynthesis protein TsaE
MKRQLLTFNPSQTKKTAKILAVDILKSKINKNALIIALEGDLGSGKTTFTQGLAKELGIKQRITSPTFVIIKKYKIFNFQFSIFNYFYHIDCYRIKNPKEILILDFKEIISNPQNIIAIEWADRIKKIIPKDAIWIKLKFIDEKIRKIIIKNGRK